MKNKYIFALVMTVATAGFTHLILLAMLSILNSDFSYFNLFSILQLSQFFPGIEKGFISLFIGGVITSGVYCYFLSKKKN